MKLPRDLSGKNLASTLCRNWDYRVSGQVGSHIVLETEVPTHHRIAIPAHKSVKPGTLGNILRAISAHKGVSKEEILASIL